MYIFGWVNLFLTLKNYLWSNESILLAGKLFSTNLKVKYSEKVKARQMCNDRMKLPRISKCSIYANRNTLNPYFNCLFLEEIMT